jgi:hypothetical protein
MTSPTPVNFGAAATIALAWASVTNPDGSTSYQGVSLDGSVSYTVLASAPAVFPPLFRVDQLGESFAALADAQSVCQSAYDSVRRAAAWQAFFQTHEPF